MSILEWFENDIDSIALNIPLPKTDGVVAKSSATNNLLSQLFLKSILFLFSCFCAATNVETKRVGDESFLVGGFVDGFGHTVGVLFGVGFDVDSSLWVGYDHLFNRFN